MENIRTLFSEICTIADDDWNLLKEKFHRQVIGKNQIILQTGQTENYLYYIEKGVLRAWLERGEQEITFEFSFENTFYSAYTSFLTQKPSTHTVQAITDMIIWKINYTDLQEVYQQSTTAQMIGRVAAENLYIEKSQREISLLKLSAEERYNNLFVEQSQLIKEIPLKYIASYIDITPQALSRIRGRIS